MTLQHHQATAIDDDSDRLHVEVSRLLSHDAQSASLQAFHRAADDPAAKDTVVPEAARAVYENVPTGYIARQASRQGGAGRALEIFKSGNQGAPRSDG